MGIRYIGDLHSLAFSKIFCRMIICSVVPLFCLKPACSFNSRLYTLFFSPFIRIMLNTLLITGSDVIPLLLLLSRKSLFLYILINNHCFHISGQVTVSQSLLNSLCSLLIVSSMSAFSHSAPPGLLQLPYYSVWFLTQLVNLPMGMSSISSTSPISFSVIGISWSSPFNISKMIIPSLHCVIFSVLMLPFLSLIPMTVSSLLQLST